jgi:hypothetical protein
VYHNPPYYIDHGYILIYELIYSQSLEKLVISIPPPIDIYLWWEAKHLINDITPSIQVKKSYNLGVAPLYYIEERKTINKWMVSSKTKEKTTLYSETIEIHFSGE